VILTYCLIAILSLVFLFYLHFDITKVLSFLGITISPSAPSFLAIFLSQYSAQAEDVRKGERLKDIQIKKEISMALISHYKEVRKELNALPIKMQNLSPRQAQFIDIHLEEENMSIIDNASDNNVEKAILHFDDCNHGFLDTFKKSESEVNVINEKIDALENKVLEFLEREKSSGINFAKRFTESKNSPNEIFGEEVFRAVYKIWSDESHCLKTISSLDSGLQGPIPKSFTLFECISIQPPDIKFNGSLTLAQIDSYSSGMDVLCLILKLLKDTDLKSKYQSIVIECRNIENLRREFSTKYDEIIKKIDQNKLLNVLKCCPFHEYKDDIMSYFEYSGLYATE
jgi:hypothetical protein